MEVESMAEQLFFITVRIETECIDKDGKIVNDVGTGFIVSYKWSDKEGLFLVTNKHVVKNAQKAKFFFIQSDGKCPILGKAYNIKLDNIQKMWYGHPNDKIDVTVMPLAVIISETQKRNWKIFFRTVSKDLLPTSEQENDLDAIEEVVFVGYPSGIYDSVNFLPVIRRGMTATPVKINYSGLPQFLIDAAVFPGSSGSPVFIFNKGSYSPRKGGLVVGSRLIFLGLISETYLRKEEGKWDFVDIPTRLTPVVKTQQMVDLGIVIKAATVFETIEAFLKSKGEMKQ
ncbi:serine protease [bacterium]|nr:serine protease [bacterium]